MRFLLCLLLAACVATFARAAETSVVLAPGSFAEGLRGWTTNGQAEFAADPAQTYRGHVPARITVAPGVAPSWQQLQFPIASVLPEDEFQASVWVRTQGVPNTPGAYIAMEYLDAAGKRVSVDHGSGNVSDASGWTQLKVNSVGPAGAKSARFNLILHSVGSAWFAAPEIRRIRETPRAEVAYQEIVLDTSRPIPGRWLGYGAEWDSRAYDEYGVNADDYALIRKRIAWMRLPIVRVMMQAKWVYRGDGKYDYETPEMKSLYRHLDICQSRGMSVILTDWGVEPQWLNTPGIRDVGDPKYAEVVGNYMQYLLEKKGYTCIDYFIMVNEPNHEVKVWERWKTGVKNIHAEFQKRGLLDRVTMMGSDTSGADAWHTMAVDEMKDTLGAYDIHRYAPEPQIRRGRVYDYYKEMWDYALTNDPRAATKPLVVAEAGVWSQGFSAGQNPLNETFDYGVNMADYAVQAAHAGSWATLAWMLDDNSHTNFVWGMWKNKKEGFALKPWFYTWSLLTRTVPPGSRLYRVEAQNPKLRILAAQIPASGSTPAGTTFVMVNRGENAATVKLKTPGGKTANLRRYLYSRTAAAVDKDGMPVPAEQVKADLAGGVEIACPADAVVFVTTVE